MITMMIMITIMIMMIIMIMILLLLLIINVWGVYETTVCMRACGRGCVFIYIYIYACVCVCVCVFVRSLTRPIITFNINVIKQYDETSLSTSYRCPYDSLQHRLVVDNTNELHYDQCLITFIIHSWRLIALHKTVATVRFLPRLLSVPTFVNAVRLFFWHLKDRDLKHIADFETGPAGETLPVYLVTDSQVLFRIGAFGNRLANVYKSGRKTIIFTVWLLDHIQSPTLRPLTCRKSFIANDFGSKKLKIASSYMCI